MFKVLVQTDNRKKKEMAKKKQTENVNLAVWQGDYKVGDKQPPKEHQFKLGQSGNPKGPPKRRTQLRLYFCKYMNMTDKELEKVKKKELTQSQQMALKIVENAKNGKYSGSERLARHVFDREEGRAVEHLIIGDENVMTEQECEQVREVLRKNQELC